MNRELSMEFVRVTEAAAIACGRSVGRGDKKRCRSAGGRRYAQGIRYGKYQRYSSYR